MYTWKEFIEETKKVDLESFKFQNTLNPQVWDRKHLKSDVHDKLMVIATDFFVGLGFDEKLIDDITFTGSLANYNWSNYSDVDLHILVDFTKIDENVKLVGEYFRAKSSIWNQKHKIEIFGFDVELYVQDSNEPHISTGVYSIKNRDWLKKPSKAKRKINLEAVKIKAFSLMDQIERAEDLYDDQNYQEAKSYAVKLKDKIKNLRRTGLYTGGQYSIENIAFKVLRRNGYLGQLFDLIGRSYDKIMSLNGNFEKKLKIYVNKAEKTENNGFNRLEEEEKYQKRVKSRHKRLKTANLGHSVGIETLDNGPYNEDPELKRAKSAPSGFGGS